MKTAGGCRPLGGKGGKGGKLLKGLKNSAPKSDDASDNNRGGSMNSDARRSKVAPTPGTLGPRRA